MADSTYTQILELFRSRLDDFGSMFFDVPAIGKQDGTNFAFRFDGAPFVSGSLRLQKNSDLLTEGVDYIVTDYEFGYVRMVSGTQPIATDALFLSGKRYKYTDDALKKQIDAAISFLSGKWDVTIAAVGDDLGVELTEAEASVLVSASNYKHIEAKSLVEAQQGITFADAASRFSTTSRASNLRHLLVKAKEDLDADLADIGVTSAVMPHDRRITFQEDDT